MQPPHAPPPSSSSSSSSTSSSSSSSSSLHCTPPAHVKFLPPLAGRMSSGLSDALRGRSFQSPSSSSSSSSSSYAALPVSASASSLLTTASTTASTSASSSPHYTPSARTPLAHAELVDEGLLYPGSPVASPLVYHRQFASSPNLHRTPPANIPNAHHTATNARSSSRAVPRRSPGAHPHSHPRMSRDIMAQAMAAVTSESSGRLFPPSRCVPDMSLSPSPDPERVEEPVLRRVPSRESHDSDFDEYESRSDSGEIFTDDMDETVLQTGFGGLTLTSPGMQALAVSAPPPTDLRLAGNAASNPRTAPSFSRSLYSAEEPDTASSTSSSTTSTMAAAAAAAAANSGRHQRAGSHDRGLLLMQRASRTPIKAQHGVGTRSLQSQLSLNLKHKRRAGDDVESSPRPATRPRFGSAPQSPSAHEQQPSEDGPPAGCQCRSQVCLCAVRMPTPRFRQRQPNMLFLQGHQQHQQQQHQQQQQQQHNPPQLYARSGSAQPRRYNSAPNTPRSSRKKTVRPDQSAFRRSTVRVLKRKTRFPSSAGASPRCPSTPVRQRMSPQLCGKQTLYQSNSPVPGSPMPRTNGSATPVYSPVCDDVEMSTSCAHPKEPSSDDFEVLEEIGRGTFGVVSRVVHKDTGRVMALKRVMRPVTSTREIVAIRRHLARLKDRLHPHLLHYESAWLEQHHFYFASELCEKGNLADFLQRQPLSFVTEAFVWAFIVQMARALLELRRVRMFHNDIKPENIYVTQRGTLKLGDFGIATTDNETHDQDGDSRYLAPEVLQSGGSYAADMYALGISAYELLMNADLPKSGIVYDDLRSGRLILERPLFHPSGVLVSTIRSMMAPDPHRRPHPARLLRLHECQVAAASIGLELTAEELEAEPDVTATAAASHAAPMPGPDSMDSELGDEDDDTDMLEPNADGGAVGGGVAVGSPPCKRALRFF